MVALGRGRGAGQLVGLIDDRHGHFAELLAVLACVVGAEEQLTTGLELHTKVGLGSATVATVCRRQGGLGGNCSGHFGLISFPSTSCVLLNVADRENIPRRTSGHVPWCLTPASNHGTLVFRFGSPWLGLLIGETVFFLHCDGVVVIAAPMMRVSVPFRDLVPVMPINLDPVARGAM